MISSRGPNNLLALDKSGVLIRDIITAVIDKDTFEDIRRLYPITDEEIILACEAFVDVMEPNSSDYIDFRLSISDESQLDVETLGLTDWVYLNCVLYGGQFIGSTNIMDLYIYGLGNILMDCLTDIKNGSLDYEISHIHQIVYDAFAKKYGQTIDQTQAEELLESLSKALENDSN